MDPKKPYIWEWDDWQKYECARAVNLHQIWNKLILYILTSHRCHLSGQHSIVNSANTHSKTNTKSTISSISNNHNNSTAHKFHTVRVLPTNRDVNNNTLHPSQISDEIEHWKARTTQKFTRWISTHDESTARTSTTPMQCTLQYTNNTEFHPVKIRSAKRTRWEARRWRRRLRYNVQRTRR